MKNSKNETTTAFWAMVSRDLLVQWRDHNEFIFRVAMLPLILIVVYGFMLPTVGLLPVEFPTHMFCGMIGMSMLITGIHGTAVPISMDFHNLREIEDRLLAPVSSRTVAYAKMTVGVLESFVGGLIVLPISLILWVTPFLSTFPWSGCPFLSWSFFSRRLLRLLWDFL